MLYIFSSSCFEYQNEKQKLIIFLYRLRVFFSFSGVQQNNISMLIGNKKMLLEWRKRGFLIDYVLFFVLLTKSVFFGRKKLLKILFWILNSRDKCELSEDLKNNNDATLKQIPWILTLLGLTLYRFLDDINYLWGNIVKIRRSWKYQKNP